MIYIELDNAERSIYELEEGEGVVNLRYASIDHSWSVPGRKAMILEEDEDLDVTFTLPSGSGESQEFTLSISNVAHLYYSLDYLIKHSNLEVGKELRMLELLKFEKVIDK